MSHSIFPDPNPGVFLNWLMYRACKFYALSDSWTRKISTAGAVADYFLWGKDRFETFSPLSRREDLWGLMADRCGGENPVRIFEFGVAWGYSTAWWLNRVKDPTLKLDAFDRFTGLPEKWRSYPAGFFDNRGMPPKIFDPRVVFHVGDVADTIQHVELDRDSEEQWCVLFDFDLFSPSLETWSAISSKLRPNDLLYFDEAFDRDERHLLDRYVLREHTYDLVGATSMALALQVSDVGKIPAKGTSPEGPAAR